MTKPSELVGRLEKQIEKKTKRLKKKIKGNVPKLIIFGLIGLYFFGMFINSINRGIRSTFATPDMEPVKSIWEFNPILNWAAIFTPTGLAVMAVCVIFFILFNKKGYHWLSGYRFTKDKRGFDILPDGTHGTSGWMKPDEMVAVCDVGEVAYVKTTLLGKYKEDVHDDDEFADYIGLKDKNGLNRNAAIFGAAGAGKSRGFVKPFIMQAARRKESLVLVDPKGEFYQNMAGFLTDEGYTVKCFNLIDMENSDSFNCFSVIGQDTDMAIKVAQIIMDNTQWGESSNPFWDISEQNLLTALILYVASPLYTGSERSLGEVYRLLSTIKFDKVAPALEGLADGHPAKAPFIVFSQANESIWGNIASGLGVRLQVYTNKLAGAITCHDEIDFKLPGQKPCAYFCVIPDQDSSKAFLSTLFFQMLFSELYNEARRHGGALPVPVNMVMDEFCNVGKFPKFVETISTARSRNIGIQIILQSLPQLLACYGKDEGNAILTNCDTQLFLGCNDLDTAKFFSQKIGAVTIRVNNNQMPMAPLFSPVYSTTRPYSQTRSNVERDLMKLDEVLRLPNKECIVSLRGQKPMLLYKIIPDELPNFGRLRTVSVTEHVPDWRKPQTCVNPTKPQKSVADTAAVRAVDKTVKDVVALDFRIKVLIPYTEVWADDASTRPVHVMNRFLGAEVDYIVSEVDRAGDCVVASRKLALQRRRKSFQKRLPETGNLVDCRAIAVSATKMIVECGGYDAALSQNSISYGTILDLREDYRPGQSVKAVFKGLEDDRIKLSIKEVNPHPFDNVETRHPLHCRRVSRIMGKYADGVFCELEKGFTCMCIYLPEQKDKNFDPGDNVIIVVTRYDYANKLVYGRIVTGW